MKTTRSLIVASLLLTAGSARTGAQDAAPKAAPIANAAGGAFVVKPYIQLGHVPSKGTLQLLWHADDADWAVDHRPGAGRDWQTAAAPSSRRVAVARVAPHRVYRAALTGLEPGGTFTYRVRKGNEVVFSSEARAAKGADQPYRFVAFGDVGAGTPEERAVAYRTHLARPDFVMITGDIVYARGRVSEYRDKFWPMLNADEASPTVGAPLMRSTLFLAAPGNHDIATRDLGKYPDGLGYFSAWDQPLNGPAGAIETSYTIPLTGPDEDKAAFLASAGPAYPRMANFSFDYGNAHWTVLDANPYVDWNDRDLRAWVARDLVAAKGATWRFVSFHHPGFNSARTHFEQQKMRLVAPVFEEGKVDVVFNGHVHNYQRSYPLRFVPDPAGDAKGPKGQLVAGKWTLDKAFGERGNTRPEGVIYLVTGAGGQHLYNPEQQDDPGSWQGFTHKFISKVHSLTVADVDGPTLTIAQVSADGSELDRFVINKSSTADRPAAVGGR